MWMILAAETQRWIWKGGAMARAGESVEVFLDFDPVCPGWPPDDAQHDLDNTEMPQKGGSDVQQHCH